MPTRVLVVDDDDAIRLLVTRLFKRRGYEVESASDGVEAVERLEATQFDLLILDMMMPRLDGIGVIERLVSTKPSVMPRILVMTAAAPSVVKTLPAEHIRKVITKPFDLATLVREAEQALAADGREEPAAANAHS